MRNAQSGYRVAIAAFIIFFASGVANLPAIAQPSGKSLGSFPSDSLVLLPSPILHSKDVAAQPFELRRARLGEGTLREPREDNPSPTPPSVNPSNADQGGFQRIFIPHGAMCGLCLYF